MAKYYPGQRRGSLLHFIRDPFNLVVSAYFYHRLFSESWVNSTRGSAHVSSLKVLDIGMLCKRDGSQAPPLERVRDTF